MSLHAIIDQFYLVLFAQQNLNTFRQYFISLISIFAHDNFIHRLCVLRCNSAKLKVGNDDDDVRPDITELVSVLITSSLLVRGWV